MGQVSAVAAVATAIAALFGLVGLLGACVVWLRRGISKERDEARVNTIAALREVADVGERLGDVRLAEANDWARRLERHHAAAHGRCQTGPERDG